MFCNKCGHEFKEGSFCPGCGQPVGAPLQPQRPPVASPPPSYARPTSAMKPSPVLKVLLIVGCVVFGLLAIIFFIGLGSTPPASSAAATAAPASATSSNSSAASEAAPIGTRLNPAKIGDTVTYEMNSLMYGHGTLELTMTGILRGEEATKAALAYNDLNSPPETGKEYVIATFRIKNVKNLSAEDAPVEVNSAQFDFSDSSYAKEKQINFVIVENSLNSELYEGAETTGTVELISPEGDGCFAVYQDKLWFSLS